LRTTQKSHEKLHILPFQHVEFDYLIFAGTLFWFSARL